MSLRGGGLDGKAGEIFGADAMRETTISPTRRRRNEKKRRRIIIGILVLILVALALGLGLGLGLRLGKKDGDGAATGGQGGTEKDSDEWENEAVMVKEFKTNRNYGNFPAFRYPRFSQPRS